MWEEVGNGDCLFSCDVASLGRSGEYAAVLNHNCFFLWRLEATLTWIPVEVESYCLIVAKKEASYNMEKRRELGWVTWIKGVVFGEYCSWTEWWVRVRVGGVRNRSGRVEICEGTQRVASVRLPAWQLCWWMSATNDVREYVNNYGGKKALKRNIRWSHWASLQIFSILVNSLHNPTWIIWRLQFHTTV